MERETNGLESSKTFLQRGWVSEYRYSRQGGEERKPRSNLFHSICNKTRLSPKQTNERL